MWLADCVHTYAPMHKHGLHIGREKKKKKRERYKTKKEKRHEEIRGVKNMDCPVKSN